MGGARRIADLQNSDRLVVLRRAIAVAHRHALRAQAVSLIVSVVMAGLSVLARTVPAAAPTVVLVGAAWAGVYAIFVVPWIGRHLRTGATLQEMFDVALFRLPWNNVAVGEPVPDHEVSRLSRRFRGDERRLRDYYLVADVPEPYDVLFCLEQNLAWGSRVRRRYANIVVGLVLLWCASGIIAGIVSGLTVADLVSTWFVPSLALLLLGLEVHRTQMSNTRERNRVLELLEAALPSDGATATLTPRPAWTDFARKIQDALFHIRCQQSRVPEWLFRRWHDTDRADFQFKMRALEARVNGASAVAR